MEVGRLGERVAAHAEGAGEHEVAAGERADRRRQRHLVAVRLLELLHLAQEGAHHLELLHHLALQQAAVRDAVGVDRVRHRRARHREAALAARGLLRQAVGEVDLLGAQPQRLGALGELLEAAEQRLEPLALLRAHPLELAVLLARELVARHAGRGREAPGDEGERAARRADAGAPEVAAVEEEVEHPRAGCPARAPAPRAAACRIRPPRAPAGGSTAPQARLVGVAGDGAAQLAPHRLAAGDDVAARRSSRGRRRGRSRARPASSISSTPAAMSQGESRNSKKPS